MKEEIQKDFSGNTGAAGTSGKKPGAEKEYKSMKDMNPQEKKEYVRSEILSYLLYFLVAVVITIFLLSFVGQRMVVNGPSMENTLHNGESVIVDKLSYRFSDPKRFDIVVFPYAFEEDTLFIKRVIGLPGETVRIDKEGKIYINGEVLEENYGRETMKSPGRAEKEITLGSDEFFVLGDNRNNSTDSRDSFVGNIKKSELVGRAFIRIWPLNKFGLIKHQ